MNTELLFKAALILIFHFAHVYNDCTDNITCLEAISCFVCQATVQGASDLL